MIAYIPFLTPISGFHDYWYFLIVPLAFGISVIYRAVRLQSLDHFWRKTGILTAQIILAMIALAVGLAVLVQLVIPTLPTR